MPVWATTATAGRESGSASPGPSGSRHASRSGASCRADLDVPVERAYRLGRPMLVRVRPIPARLFPNGPDDVLRQVRRGAAADYADRLTRGWIDDGQGAAIAFENARH